MQKRKIIEESYLFDEDAHLRKLPNDFSYKKIEFESYQVGIEQQRQYIFAVYDASTLKDVTRYTRCNTTELIISLLTLKQSMPTDLFESFYMGSYTNFIVSNEIIESIIKWCRKYGFPLYPGDEYYTGTGQKKLLKANMKQHIRFYVSDFLYKLIELSGFFFLYQVITGQVTVKAVEKDEFVSVSNEKESATGKVAFKRICQMKSDEPQKIFEKKYRNISYNTVISFEGVAHLEVQAQSAFDAAFYELALLVEYPEKTLRICPICHSFFEPSSRKQKYCDTVRNGRLTCYPQKAYKRSKTQQKSRGQSS